MHSSPVHAILGTTFPIFRSEFNVWSPKQGLAGAHEDPFVSPLNTGVLVFDNSSNIYWHQLLKPVVLSNGQSAKKKKKNREETFQNNPKRIPALRFLSSPKTSARGQNVKLKLTDIREEIESGAAKSNLLPCTLLREKAFSCLRLD